MKPHLLTARFHVQVASLVFETIPKRELPFHLYCHSAFDSEGRVRSPGIAE